MTYLTTEAEVFRVFLSPLVMNAESKLLGLI